jgi:tRNA-2-methylthio-N6-dimethylallyladenosine synthase
MRSATIRLPMHDSPKTHDSSGGAPSVYLETFGCQMNELDSELVRGQLHALGYRFVESPGGADIVLYNTCSVREQAENKVLSRVGIMGLQKKAGSNVVLGVIGCMAEREGAGMMSRFPQIDLMCGPGELDKLPMLLDNALKTGMVERADRVALQGNRSRRSSTLAAAEDSLEMLDLSRAFDPERASAGGRSAYVRITRGCNKFCTYCVVPYTRGAEVHRPPDAIVEECKRLVDQGVIEVTLLGQTVNHYVYVHGTAVTVSGLEMPQIGGKPTPARVPSGSRHGGTSTSSPTPQAPRVNGHQPSRTTSFADLLRRIHEEVPEIRRLRFVTSYARDFGDDILHVMADSPRICRYLHLPAQSGSNRMLRLMNRGYTVEEYMIVIERARTWLPDVQVAGDIIVGFSSEKDEDFEATRALLKTVRFKNNFIFKYSPRPGTTAFDRLPDDVPDDVKRARNNELLALQNDISHDVHRALVGRTVDVFVESASAQRSAPRNGEHHGVDVRWETPAPRRARLQLVGRTGGDMITAFDAPNEVDPRSLIGRIVQVRIQDARPLLLVGELVGGQLGGQMEACASADVNCDG